MQANLDFLKVLDSKLQNKENGDELVVESKVKLKFKNKSKSKRKDFDRTILVIFLILV